jgi:hypothetical protein
MRESTLERLSGDFNLTNVLFKIDMIQVSSIQLFILRKQKGTGSHGIVRTVKKLLIYSLIGSTASSRRKDLTI